jgi:hypothetical protein
MIRRTLATAALIVLPTILVAQSPIRAGALKVSEPVKVTELDMDKLKGQPSRLAWSEDGMQLYVQTMEGNFGQPGQKHRHYVVNVAEGSRKDLQVEPEWAAAYWTTKSGQASPDGPPLKIELKQETRTEQTVSTPMGGALARGGTGGDTGTGAGEAIAAADNRQRVMVNAMVLRGTTVGEFVNSVIVPGLTFGWGPKGTKVIAFADPKSGRVIVLDEKGEKREVPGTKAAILPAWSGDAKQIAWLQKEGKKKYVLQIARVESGT